MMTSEQIQYWMTFINRPRMRSRRYKCPPECPIEGKIWSRNCPSDCRAGVCCSDHELLYNGQPFLKGQEMAVSWRNMCLKEVLDYSTRFCDLTWRLLPDMDHTAFALLQHAIRGCGANLFKYRNKIHYTSPEGKQVPLEMFVWYECYPSVMMECTDQQGKL